MKIYTKILIITLPIVLLSILISGGGTYLINLSAISQAAEKWLLTILPETAEILQKYQSSPENASGSLQNAQAQAITELTSLKVGDLGYVFVIDRAGIVLGHPDSRRQGLDVSQEKWFQQMQNNPQGGKLAFKFKWYSERYLSLFQYNPTWSWYIVVADPYHEVYTPIGKTQIIIMVAATIFLTAIALLLLAFTHRLTYPLYLMQVSAEQVGRGNLAIRIPVKTNDEFGILTNVFNKMTAQLQGSLQALQKSEQHYRSLIENTSEIIHIVNKDGIITYMSPSGEKILGYKQEQVIGKSLFDFMYPDDLQRAIDNFQILIGNEGLTPSTEIRARNNQGAWVTFESVGNNLLNDPTVNGVVLHSRPIDERKRAERLHSSLYRISEATHRTHNLDELFPALHAIISELMPAQNFYVALYNHANNTLDFPYFIDEFDAKPIEPQPLGRGLTEYVLRTGKPLLALPKDFEKLMQMGEVDLVGSPSIDWLGVPLKAGDKPLGVMVVQSYTENIRFGEKERDILTFVSEQAAMAILRKQAEEALRENETRYRELFENSPISLWEEDFSQVKDYIDELRKQGVKNFQTYFESHTEAVQACMGKIKILDVNTSTLKMYDASSKQEMLDKTQGNYNSGIVPLFIDELVAIAEDKHEFEGYGTAHKLNGSPIDIVLRWTVPSVMAGTLASQPGLDPRNRPAPGSVGIPTNGNSYSRLIVSILDITGRKRAEEQVQRQLQRLNALRAIDTSITGSMDLQSTLNVLLEQVITQLGVDAASVLLLDPNILLLQYAANSGFMTQALHHTQLRLGQGYAGKAAYERRLVQIPDLRVNPGQLELSPQLDQEGFITYFATPLIAKGQVKGVLEIFHRSFLNPTLEWLEFLDMLGRQAAIAIDNASLFSDLQRSNIELTMAYDATIEGWSRALDMRDQETEGHTLRVTDMCLRLATEMGINRNTLVFMRWGALLHDIGKMAISDTILLKGSPLTKEERQLMRRHPVYAYEMLLPISYLRPALDIPHYHHERWNGTGYPSHLKGEQIPLSARIFCIVDVWDALCSNRPYRKAWNSERVLRYIHANSGRHFDPVVVEAFLKMVETDNEQS